MGVHEEHCCTYCGCKYGEPDCPVTTGLAKQKYPCDNCADGWIEDDLPPDPTGFVTPEQFQAHLVNASDKVAGMAAWERHLLGNGMLISSCLRLKAKTNPELAIILKEAADKIDEFYALLEAAQKHYVEDPGLQECLRDLQDDKDAPWAELIVKFLMIRKI